MTKEEMQQAIAEFAGFTKISGTPFKWGYLGEVFQPLPKYTEDLNAMHETVERIVGEKDGDLERAFLKHLSDIVKRREDSEDVLIFEYETALVQATAAQRAEALLRAIGRWID